MASAENQKAKAEEFLAGRRQNLNIADDNAEAEAQDNIDELKELITNFIEAAKTVQNDIQQIKIARVTLINLAQSDLSFSQMTAKVVEVSMPANPSGDYDAMLQAYREFQQKLDEIIDTVDDPAIVNMEAKAKALLREIDEANIVSLFTDVRFLSDELQNKRNFTATAPPVQADGDYIHYSVSITPVRTNILGAHKSPKSFDFDIPVRGGFKTDFSVGPTFSFGSGAFDEKYYLRDADTEGKVILKKRENNNILSPGIAAMMHFYERNYNNVNWGGMLGAGAGFQSMEDADISFYTGISLILGKQQKIMISGGASFLKVERLKKDEYSEDLEYPDALDLNDVTEKVLRPSFFLSISYNLTSRENR